jgi:acetyl esterase/lipase
MRGARLAVVAALLLAIGCSGSGDPTRPLVQRGVSYGPGLALDVYRPVRAIAPLPTIVLVHGGAFSAGSRADMADFAEALVGRGFAAVTIDYHLRPGGPWFPAHSLTAPGLVAAAATARADGLAAVRWLQANAAPYRIDPERIGVLGYSAGAITAIEMATHPPPRLWLVVSVEGAAIDQRALARSHPPMLLVHGNEDVVIPLRLAQATCAAAGRTGGCALERIDGMGHDYSARFRDVVGFVNAFLDRNQRA